MEYPPSKYQKEQNYKLEKYYSDIEFTQSISFGNVVLRPIDWQKDIYQKQIIVGDGLAVSDEQAKEHFLDKQFEIKAPDGRMVWVGYVTNPEEKCRSDEKNVYCPD